MSAAVTPLGVRDGDPAAVAALVQRRGAAVLGYCEEVAAPGAAVGAAAEAFADFRGAVADAGDVGGLDPEGQLVRATRFSAARHAPDAGRGAPMVPTLLAARAEGDLGEADDERLSRLLSRSGDARRSADRMRRGEAAYTDPVAALPPRAAGPMVAALLAAPAAGDVVTTLHRLGEGLGWGPEQVDDAIAAAGVTREPAAAPRERDLVASIAPAAAGAAAAATLVAPERALVAESATPPPEDAPPRPPADDNGHKRRAAILVGGLAGAAAIAAAALAIAGVFGGDEPSTTAGDTPAVTQAASTPAAPAEPVDETAKKAAEEKAAAEKKAAAAERKAAAARKRAAAERKAAARRRAARERRAAARRRAAREAAQRSAAAPAATPAPAPAPAASPAPVRTPAPAPSRGSGGSGGSSSPTPGQSQIAPGNGAASAGGGVPTQPDPGGADLTPPG